MIQSILYLLLLVLSQVISGSTVKMSKPNFIIILTDDQQFDAVGFNGNTIIKTPNIDQMASRGLQFKDAHVAFSLCSPSRAAILTGRYGINNGVLGLGSALNSDEVSFASLLKKQNYRTAHFGKWHVKQSPKDLGFDTWSYFESNGTYYGRKVINQTDTLFPDIHCDEFIIDQAIEFLDNAQDPFVAFICSQTPHMNGTLIWDAKPDTKNKYKVEDMPIPDTRLDDLSSKPEYLKTVRNLTQAKNYGYPAIDAIQEHTRDYYSVITELDEFLGDLFQKIDDKNLLENTYIIYLSDNGWMLGDHGFTSKVLPYQPSTHIPFWIAGPGISAGVNNALVTNLDILPTILDLAEVSIPENIDGRSIKPILHSNGEGAGWDYLVYEGLGTYGGAKHNLCIIDDKYRYIETYNNKLLDGIIYQELYDRASDRIEMVNLANNQKYNHVIAAYQEKIKLFKQENLNVNNLK